MLSGSRPSHRERLRGSRCSRGRLTGGLGRHLPVRGADFAGRRVAQVVLRGRSGHAVVARHRPTQQDRIRAGISSREVVDRGRRGVVGSNRLFAVATTEKGQQSREERDSKSLSESNGPPPPGCPYRRDGSAAARPCRPERSSRGPGAARSATAYAESAHGATVPRRVRSAGGPCRTHRHLFTQRAAGARCAR